MMTADKSYLGDGAYVEDDGYCLWLTTSNGITETNRICLEPEVLAALLRYVERRNDRRRAATADK